MSDLKTFQTLVDDVWEMVFGTIRRPLKYTDLSKFEGMMTDKKPKRARGEDRRKTDRGNDRRFNKFGEPEKPKRARGDYGRYKADNKSTPDVNEAWVGGKAPKRKRKK